MMMKIYVVVDVDNNEIVKAFYGDEEYIEEKVSDFCDQYYDNTGFDCTWRITTLKSI